MTSKRRGKTEKRESAEQPQTLVGRMISAMEKDRFTVVTGFLFLMAVALARAWLEGWVFGYASLNLYYYAWQVSFFATVFMGATMVLSLFSGAGLKKTANVTLLAMPIILLPPLLDYLVFGTGGLENADLYNYLNRETIVNFLMPFSGVSSSWGLVIQGWCALVLGVTYLWEKTRSAFRSAAGCLSILGLILFLAARPFILTTDYVFVGTGYEQYITLLSILRFPVLNYYGWLPDTAYIGYLIYQQKVLFYIAYNVILFIVLFCMSMLISNRDGFRGVFGSVRGLRMAHFSIMTVLGMLMVRVADPDFSAGLALDPFYILHLPYITLAIMSISFAWQFTTMLNDIYDIKIDRIAHPDRGLVKGIIPEGQYRTLALMFGILALCTSAVLGLIPFILIALFLVLAIIYSMPPVRFREHVLGTSIIGLGSFIAYYLGVYSPGHWEVVYWEVVDGTVVNQMHLQFARFPPLSGDILLVGFMILVGLTLAPMMTQMRDYEGDMKAGSKSIFTVLGFERGRRLVCILVPLLFLMPLVMINQIWDVLLLSSLAAVSFMILLKSKNIMPVFAVYFVAAMYTLLRILQ